MSTFCEQVQAGQLVGPLYVDKQEYKRVEQHTEFCLHKDRLLLCLSPPTWQECLVLIAWLAGAQLQRRRYRTNPHARSHGSQNDESAASVHARRPTPSRRPAARRRGLQDRGGRLASLARLSALSQNASWVEPATIVAK